MGPYKCEVKFVAELSDATLRPTLGARPETQLQKMVPKKSVQKFAYKISDHGYVFNMFLGAPCVKRKIVVARNSRDFVAWVPRMGAGSM